MNKELQKHYVYKQLNEFIYHPDKKQYPKNTVWLYKSENKDTGFYAGSFKYQDRIVIVFRGTDDIQDKINDIKMASGNIPKQTTDAIRFIKQMKEKYPNSKIDLTGQSLGGTLAQLGHVLEKGINETVTFQPYGTSVMLKDYLSKYNIKNPVDKITNYCNYKDGVTSERSYNKQIGNCYEIFSRPKPNDSKELFYNHKIEHIFPLETRIPANWKYQSPLSKLKSDASQQSSNGCTGEYWVNEYTRSDGTVVRGHNRTCEKHTMGKDYFIGKKFQDIPPEHLAEGISYFI